MHFLNGDQLRSVQKKREMVKNKEIGGSLVAIFKRICAKCIDKVDQKGWKDVPKR